MNRVIVIVGPTGVGKTKLSIELAKHFKTEIINGDSVQVYKELNIGSAKVSKEENIPVLSLVLDEQTGKTGYITRIEAFVDLVKRKKFKNLKNNS